MNEAKKMTTEAKDDNFDLTMAKEEVKKMSGELYNILSQHCTGEALTIVRSVTTFEGFVAWQRLHKKFSPKTMARAIRLMAQVASPKAVREFQEVEEALTSWENKVKKLESEYGKKLSNIMKTAIVTGMSKTSSTPTSTTPQGTRRWWTSSGRCPNGCWRGARRALGGGDGRLGRGGRAGSGSGNAMPSLWRVEAHGP